MRGIYTITCTVLKVPRVYVGSSAAIAGRWAVHISHLELGRHHNSALQRDWTRYGAKNFKFEAVRVVPSPGSLLVAEQAIIDKLKPYYNKVSAAAPIKSTTHGKNKLTLRPKQ